MAKQKAALQSGYVVRVRPEGDGYLLRYLPRRLQQECGPGGTPKPIPAYDIRINYKEDTWEWVNPPAEQHKGPLVEDARERVRNLRVWVEQLNQLIGQIEGWVKDLGWVTKRIERSMEDSGIGNYKAPALVMQDPEDASRVLLDPVSRIISGTEGVVNLYLMPAYDDVATLYYYEDRWNVHYVFGGEPVVGDLRAVGDIALSQEILARVLAEIKSNA